MRKHVSPPVSHSSSHGTGVNVAKAKVPTELHEVGAVQWLCKDVG